jgi:hypothetical protein
MRAYEDLPMAASHRLIDFEQAEIVTLESDPPQYALVVRGTKPYLNMKVKLVPLVYVRRPEYWGIEWSGAFAAGSDCQPLLLTPPPSRWPASRGPRV